MGIQKWFGWKQALIVQSVFYSLGLLQQDFYLGQLWFIINCFVLLLLLRATYSDSASGRLMAWYIYCLSIFTDLISFIAFGHDLDGGGTKTFVLVMAIFLLLPKPLFLFFLYKQLKDEGIDIKQGVKYSQLHDHLNINGNNNNINGNNNNNINGNNNNNNNNNINGNNNVDNANQQQQSQQPQQPQEQQQQQRFAQQSTVNNPSTNNTQDFLNSGTVYPVISNQ
jgi:hypothetical protein